MRILKKLAAAAALVMAISTLAACGNDSPKLNPQNPGTPNHSTPSPGTNPFGANNIADELSGEILRSKVTSADSYAKELVTTVNSWIADDVAMGGAEKRACEIGIVMNNGSATITDASGENDWEGRTGDKPGCPESLKERFEADYSGRTFTAKVFVDKSGYAVYSWIVRDDAGYNGVAPTVADFEAGYFAGWKSDQNGEKKEGLTEDDVIIGTSPRLSGGRPYY